MIVSVCTILDDHWPPPSYMVATWLMCKHDSGSDGRMSLYRIPITRKIIILFEPNVHYVEFGIMNTKSCHYTETLFPLDLILVMPKRYQISLYRDSVYWKFITVFRYNRHYLGKISVLLPNNNVKHVWLKGTRKGATQPPAIWRLLYFHFHFSGRHYYC